MTVCKPAARTIPLEGLHPPQAALGPGEPRISGNCTVARPAAFSTSGNFSEATVESEPSKSGPFGPSKSMTPPVGMGPQSRTAPG